jgi:electron transfer flavoprotein beta subunit
MNVVVCVKQIIDPEAPPSSFKIDVEARRVIPPPGVPLVISTFDEYAVEAALRIKDVLGAKVTALSLGNDFVRDVIKKPISMGADELVLLEDEAFAGGDSWSTAHALALAIKKIGQVDLVLCGRQAADSDSGQVGPGLAELLGLPCVNIARKVEITDGKARVERVIPDGYEVIEVSLPAVITISNEHPVPRYPNVRGIMAAKRKEPIIWKPQDIGMDPSQAGARGRLLKLLKLYQPVRDSRCEIIGGNTAEEAGANLADRMKEAGLI